MAESAAETAFAFAGGKGPAGETTLFNTPSKLFTPKVITKENIATDLLTPDGALKVSEVCTSTYAAACTAAGVKTS